MILNLQPGSLIPAAEVTARGYSYLDCSRNK
jgi:hypothetical protein